MPTASLVNQTYQRLSGAHLGRLTDTDAKELIKAADKENRDSSSGWFCCSSNGTAGAIDLNNLLHQHMSVFEPAAQDRLVGWLDENPVRRNPLVPTLPSNTPGKVLIDVQARHRTWTCNWFPMGLHAHEPGANLYYSPTGPSVCEKYDQVTQKHSTDYEKANHAGNRVSWAGHCDMAARVCCLLQEPVKSVTYNGVNFTINDIQGLLVMVSNDLRGNEPFIGRRNNGNAGEDPNEPYPAELLPQLLKLIKTGEPWVADIDPGLEVWNYAFDRAKITEHSMPPDGLPLQAASRGGRVRYQKWELSGTGYNEEARHFRSWIEYASTGEALASGWYHVASDGKDNFDFVWQPKARGDLSQKSNWPTFCTYNPEIDPQLVFELYRQSI